MSEPQPPDAADVEVPPAPAASAEDRKAAAALSTLDARGDDASTAPKPEVDTAALGEAMSRLEMLDKQQGKNSKSDSASAKDDTNKKEPPKKVKVEAADVALLTEYLELSKPKATELLKAHDGKLEPALEAWIKAGA